ncbi:hypothetical protein BCR37DRAFT_376335 [Protomyces lactucae-debilis]|uniref:Uncharacterized protein n=1 Tax=Protomyces lactucae-debilis TaxID=2754530 RepID=A0A1Y2FSK9_PROLT|nr:uncharacterized protein BCR37DRAFT_376335 [Protomyces lactucae-debilis]ORY86992.1 hypothetical protein BCR37DRAFT_376335 [Protomyces lactucae-debilis]
MVAKVIMMHMVDGNLRHGAAQTAQSGQHLPCCHSEMKEAPLGAGYILCVQASQVTSAVGIRTQESRIVIDRLERRLMSLSYFH